MCPRRSGDTSQTSVVLIAGVSISAFSGTPCSRHITVQTMMWILMPPGKETILRITIPIGTRTIRRIKTPPREWPMIKQRTNRFCSRTLEVYDINSGSKKEDLETHRYYMAATTVERFNHGVIISGNYNSMDSTKGYDYKKMEPLVSRKLKFTRMNRGRETIATRLRFGKCALNFYFKIISKHATGNCSKCNVVPETIEHFILQCPKNLELVIFYFKLPYT